MLAIGAWRVPTGDITLGTLVQVVTLFGLLESRAVDSSGLGRQSTAWRPKGWNR
jgi:ABC-type bacteriocin/lantibiotic exporter with double-glycine peptidase domain